jgi:hypothetical protein
MLHITCPRARAGLPSNRWGTTAVWAVCPSFPDRTAVRSGKSPNRRFRTDGPPWRTLNTTIMSEWLHAFYQHIGTTREVLLTMDNLSAHNTALELCPPPTNIRICWLPANSTSRFQPLDQGIIQSFKCHYRRQWLSFMLDAFTSDRNLLTLMNLHFAVRWILRSWNHYVTNTTIYIRGLRTRCSPGAVYI